jgi:hypothetical protein
MRGENLAAMALGGVGTLGILLDTRSWNLF